MPDRDEEGPHLSWMGELGDISGFERRLREIEERERRLADHAGRPEIRFGRRLLAVAVAVLLGMVAVIALGG
jgi:hypothetical protein